MIREASAEDSQAIADIYAHYINNTVITFEEQPVTAEDFVDRIKRVQAAGFSWLVAEEKGEIIGFAYSTKWRERSAYRHTAEVSVYLANGITSRGWGTKLYEVLFSTLRAQSIHIAIGGIALPNDASIALHEKFGMKKVAHFKEVGYKFGRWLDVAYWQVQLSPET